MKLTKEEKSWITYDWANSAYSITITTAIFPIFFAQIAEKGGLSGTESTAALGFGNSLYALIIAFLAPVLGTISDYKGKKKKFFTFFFLLGVIFSVGLALVNGGMWQTALFFYMMTGIGFAGANIFYDAFLVDVTTIERMDRVSTDGYGWGYIGSCIPFLASLGIIFLFGLGEEFTLPEAGVKVAFLITALWWGLFTIPFIRNVKQKFGIESEKNYIINSFKRLGSTFSKIKNYRRAFIFLLAYFFYIDGVGTIIKMATDFAMKMGVSSVIILVVLVFIQVLAFPFALLYGKISSKTGPKFMLYVGIIVYMLITILGFFMENIPENLLIPYFFLIAFLVATSQGGIQALSRSYFGSLIPPEQAGEFFGFFNIFGKFAAIMGPAVMGIVITLTGSHSLSILSLVFFFIIGGILLIATGKDEHERKAGSRRNQSAGN